MPVWRAVGTTIALTLVNLNVATCRSTSGEGGGEPASSAEKPEPVRLEGVDTSKLTPRELSDWSSYVTELLAPCPDQPVSLAQCVKESRACDLCRPAAEFLVAQVRRGRTRSQAEAAFRARFSPDTVKAVPSEGSPAKGPKDAEVTIVEWADFECPFCGMASPLLDKTVKAFDGHVRLVFKHYPLNIHEHAENAARAAVAAGKQGKFWEMHHDLFENQSAGLDRKAVDRIARDLGLDMKQFAADIVSEEVADAVNRDRKQAEKLGLRGTPMIYINGRHFELEDFDLMEDLQPWIQLEIQQRTGKNVAPRAVPEAGSSESPESPTPAGSAAPKSTAPTGSASTAKKGGASATAPGSASPKAPSPQGKPASTPEAKSPSATPSTGAKPPSQAPSNASKQGG